MNTTVVLGFNQKMEELAKILIKSLLLFSKFDITVIGYNYKPDFNNNKIKVVELQNINEQHIAAIAKMNACIASIEQTNYDNFIWIDTDAIVTKYIDNVEIYFNRILNYPLIGSHLHNYFLMTDQYHPNGVIPIQFLERFFKEKVKQHRPWLHACLFVFNKKCQWFFEENKKLFDILNNFNYSWINDELIFNYLMSRYNFLTHMEVKILNVFNVNVFDEFLETQNLTNELFQKSESVITGSLSLDSILPKNVEELFLFHGIRDANYSKNVLERYIDNIAKF